MAVSRQEDPLVFDTDRNSFFRIGVVQYVALGELKEVVCPPLGHQRFLTVLPTDPSNSWTKDTLVRSLNDLDEQDDVCCVLFKKFVLFAGTCPGKINLPRNVIVYLENSQIGYGVAEMGCAPEDAIREGKVVASRPLAQGPYLKDDNGIRPIWRLYEDSAVALMGSLTPSTTERPYCSLHVSGGRHAKLLVAVPPRRLIKTENDHPNSLLGKRIVIKDVFDVTGLRISACNKAYLDVSTIARETAPMVQRLIDCGAVVVGTSRLSSLISREEPSESLDYSVPFNPRGDGYQSPAGSSSGSAAAVAAYDWLDFGIGTDSTGSARRPAMANGVFSIRISHGVLPHTGMVPCFPMFDTPAVFTRKLRDLDAFVSQWCGPTLSTTVKAPTSILVPKDYFPVSDARQQDIVDRFVRELCAHFSINIRHVCLRELWEHNPPHEAVGQPLDVYLHDVGQNSFFYDFYHSTDAFRATYEQKYYRQPAVNRVTKWRWDIARGISKAQRDEAVRRLGVYKKWLLEIVLVGENPIVLLPVADAVPKYRDTPACSPGLQEAWDQLWMSPILGSPEITVPIGHISYPSRISGTQEMLPVAISLMGLPGTDISLINTAKLVLARPGRHMELATGKEMFADGWEMVERTSSL